MRRVSFLAWSFLLAALPLAADTILQNNAEGRPQVIQRDAIVVSQDSSTLIYKHFDLKQRRVESVSLPQESLPYKVETSSADARKHVVALWKEFGYTADVTDLQGKVTRLYDVYLDFYPPTGGFFTEPVPATTQISIQLDSGGIDDVALSKILKIEIAGDRLKLVLRDNTIEQGKVIFPTQQPAEIHLMGITDHYDPASKDIYDYSVTFKRLKQVDFTH